MLLGLDNTVDATGVRVLDNKPDHWPNKHFIEAVKKIIKQEDRALACELSKSRPHYIKVPFANKEVSSPSTMVTTKLSHKKHHNRSVEELSRRLYLNGTIDRIYSLITIPETSCGLL